MGHNRSNIIAANIKFKKLKTNKITKNSSEYVNKFWINKSNL